MRGNREQISNFEFRISNFRFSFRQWRRSRRCGFTLLETVVAVGIFAIVIITVTNFWLGSTRLERVGAQRQKIIAEANILLDQISREIRTYELAYRGVLDYNRSSPAETLYTVDTTIDSNADNGNPYLNTNIYKQENELVLYDNRGDELTTGDDTDTVIAYAYWPDGSSDLCPDDTGATPGFFRFYKDAANQTLTCTRLFNSTGLTVTNAGFLFTQPVNNEPDAVDPATEVSSSRDADCGTGTGALFTNGICTCTAANQSTACFSGTCDTATGGRCTLSSNNQPAVTFFFTVQDTNNPATVLTFQTTAAQRIYKR